MSQSNINAKYSVVASPGKF